MNRRFGDPFKNWHAALFVGALSAMATVAVPGMAHAEGFFDFLFGGFQQRRAPPPQASSYAEPSATFGRISPAPLGAENVRQGNATVGRSFAFCVRLCDGQNFPMEHMANATPVETCRAMCPTSKTKVFFGSEIDHATASDGAHYADSGNAYVYRKQMVANCTCNGKDAFGLTPLNVNTDPTLRPGDIVMTKTGPVAYTGRRGQSASFTPVDASQLNAELLPAQSRERLSRRTDVSVAEEESGTVHNMGGQAVR